MAQCLAYFQKISNSQKFDYLSNEVKPEEDMTAAVAISIDKPIVDKIEETLNSTKDVDSLIPWIEVWN